MLAATAVFTYAIAERVELSGIMAIFTCGIITRHYTFYSLSTSAQEAAITFFLSLAGAPRAAAAQPSAPAPFACRHRSAGASTWGAAALSMWE